MPFLKNYPEQATQPLTYHDWTYPTSAWWHSMGAGEQAAWAIVWATAVCGLLAAIGSFLAAWAAKAAAKTALDIAKEDRRDRLIMKQADDVATNWRAALSFEAPMQRLVRLVKLAIECIEAAENIPVDADGQRFAMFGTTNFAYMTDALGYEDIARIGNMANLAGNVSGDFGTVILQALSWSREAAALLEHVVNSHTTHNSNGVAHTRYFVDYWYVADALSACRSLERHAEVALREIDAAISAQHAAIP
ncbi:hypothetical protein [Dyella sp. C11]|uniref:hypothetical protein n=1 Tax=Dyella sp. C11 TaxID=2126991 RepID=UPI000D648017|nr:hypothetical protein [Dyella sp. C11]